MLAAPRTLMLLTELAATRLATPQEPSAKQSWLRLAADAVATVHLGVVLFVILAVPITVLGALLGWRFVRSLWFRLLHLGLILLVAGQALVDATCPLTTWERSLRRAGGQTRMSSDGRVSVVDEQVGFFGQLVREVLFIGPRPGATEQEWERFDQLLLVWYVAFACVVVWSWVYVPPRWQRELMS